MLDKIWTFPARKRAKWFVLAAWVVAAAALGPLQPRLAEAQENDPASFLPAGSESRRVLELVDERFSSRETPALVVYRRASGLTAADRARIDDDVRAIGDRAFPETAAPSPPRVSPDGTTAVVTLPITSDVIEGIQPVVDGTRELVGGGGGGLGVYVTGPAGISVDAVEVFEQIDVTLLIATSLLILVLLLLIYRSPVIAFVPLVVVALAYVVAAAAVYALVEAGLLTVNGQTTGILIILMFGAGTDYCLLLVARYREELRRHPNAHDAMAAALRRTAPTILASGATVALGMLVLLASDLQTSTGPVFALGIAMTVLAGLTLLPALLTVLGRRAFWPAVPSAGSADPARPRLWARVGRSVARRPVVVLSATTLALLAASLGNLVELPGLGLVGGIRGQVESIDGQRALAQAFPAGEGATTDVVVAGDDADEALRAAAAAPGVAEARRAGQSLDGELARLAVVLRDDPYGDEAVARIDGLRDALPASALVGGPTAEETDTRTAARRDAQVVMPLTLLAIFLVLVALLRALVAPLYLIASVVLSFAATLGLSYLAFKYVFDSPGSDPSLPLLVFVFVVALGVDYNIFLIARVREEADGHTPTEAVVRGLESTGGVITSAGVILAGTFLVLTALPLEQLFQLGFAVALGVLLDTFVVRTLLVPAVGVLLGDRSWWPSRRATAERSPRPPSAQPREAPSRT